MNRTHTAQDTGYRAANPDGAHVRGSTDVMVAVVGEVEAALKALERERNTESVRNWSWLLYDYSVNEVHSQ